MFSYEANKQTNWRDPKQYLPRLSSGKVNIEIFAKVLGVAVTLQRVLDYD